MEQFSYEEWKKNPERKVVMRSGEEVTLISYLKGSVYPLRVKLTNGNYVSYTENGDFEKGAYDERDLFFADDVEDEAQPIAQPKATNCLYWRKCKAGYKFSSDAIVIPDDERTTDRDPRLVRCAVWDSKYILIDDLKKLPVDNG